MMFFQNKKISKCNNCFSLIIGGFFKSPSISLLIILILCYSPFSFYRHTQLKITLLVMLYDSKTIPEKYVYTEIAVAYVDVNTITVSSMHDKCMD